MKSGNVYVGTVGETVEIKCPYPDYHKYTPKYFCRHPCKSSEHVLIKTASVNRSTPPPEKTHITSIWTTAVTSNKSNSYEQFSATTVQSKGSLDKNLRVSVPVVCAGVLCCLCPWFLWRLKPPGPQNPVQVSPDINQTVGDVCHLYDEIVTEYSLAGAARDGDSSAIYSTVQHCDPAPQDNTNALVEIKCPYPGYHKYTPKYFCHHPCKSEHVLIKSAKIDQVVSDGRYALIDTVSGRVFRVFIKHLRLKDSAAPVNRSTHTPENTHIKHIWWSTTLTSTDNSQYNLLLSTVQSPVSTPPVKSSEFCIVFTLTYLITCTHIDVTVVCAGVLSFLALWILVALVCIYKRRSDAKSKCKITNIH
ncbi:CMRF35-like molecule 5 [Labeo rohita]|uniref:CMRF35-like molecule 5 n=1 Tax=Labeo rohita TaxID=84645 RepID=A0ABQ8MFG1_LABRO|nr:CMRF35-like molecule 5 [Labeo rohita]